MFYEGKKMNDTRETAYQDDMTEKNSHCRFEIGDKVLIPNQGKKIECIPHAINWDKSFGGWLLHCHLIGVHEQNYILASERDLWKPHENGLWSYWTRKTKLKVKVKTSKKKLIRFPWGYLGKVGAK